MPQLLMEQIKLYNEVYRAGKPQISDEHYDTLLEKLQVELPQENYETFRKSLREPGGKVKLDYNVGSLRKCTYGTGELQAFIEKTAPKTIFVAAKLDGMGYVAHYINGVLISCSTTGDGKTGEDITAIAKYVLPGTMPIKGKLIIRGEFVMIKAKAEKFGYRNARNGVVGLLKSHEADFEKLAGVRCPAYEILNTDQSRVDQYETLYNLGFEVPDNTSLDVNEFIEEHLKDILVRWKDNSDYLIDGLVIHEFDEFPEDLLLPEKTVAFKVNLDMIKTTITDMDIKPSKDGLLRGVAIFNKIDIGGTDVSRASIYNFKYVLDNKIGPGAEVVITKAGDIIPKIVEVIKPGDIQYEAYWELCPVCGTKTRVNGVDLECPNPDCKSKVVGELNSFIRLSKVKGASPVSFEKWGIVSISDCLDFVPCGKNAEKFKADFDKKVFSTPRAELLERFNWGGVGSRIIRKYVDLLGIEKFITSALNPKLTLLEHPHGCGEAYWERITKTAQRNIIQYNLIINHPKYSPLEKNTITSNELQGKSFCCTGKVSRPRKEIEADIIAAGGEIKSVSKNLDYLIAGEKAGSKLKKAISLGIKIITETELENMLK